VTDLQDLESLSSILWHQPEERVTVRQAILNITDPGLAKVLEYLDSAREEFEESRTTPLEWQRNVPRVQAAAECCSSARRKNSQIKRERRRESIRSIQGTSCEI
jgi:hypothetical protein